MKRALNSDELGDVGESCFKHICGKARLIANKAERDRAGWDYVVDWPASELATTYDNRPAEISANVQVKAKWQGNRTVQARLSSLERLAKEIKPSFIYTPSFDAQANFVSAHVIHVRGEFSAEILKKLRGLHLADAASKFKKRSSKQVTKPNHQFMSFSIDKWGDEIEPTGEAFRDYVERSVGTQMDSYAQEKARELKELGYVQGRALVVTTTFTGSNLDALIDDISDALLGLRKIEGRVSKVIETRFNIPLPMPGVTSGTSMFEFNPLPIDECELIFRPPLGKPIVFDGKVYGVPPAIMRQGQMKMLIRTDLFNLKLTGKKTEKPGWMDIDCNLTLDSDLLEKDKRKAKSWGDHYRLFAALHSGAVRFEAHSRKADAPLAATVGELIESEQKKWAAISDMCELCAEVLEVAGCPNQRIGIMEIGDCEQNLLILGALIRDISAVHNLTFDSLVMEDVPVGEDVPMLLAHKFKLGNFWISYSAETMVKAIKYEHGLHWKGEQFRNLEVRRLKNIDKEFLPFVSEMQRRTGIDFVMTPDGENQGEGTITT